MDLIEVERKRELSDSETLRRRLAELGYREISSLTEVDTYYSRPDVDYMETVECLRVRQRDGSAEITYKPPSNTATHSAHGIIAKQETNVQLADPDQAGAANTLLTAVGMIELVRVEKARTTYRRPGHDNTVVSIDLVTGVGAFVETEIIASDSGGAATQLEDIEQAIGISTYPIVRLPYRDLVMRARPWARV
ncbi:class IV adenylate cyclase [Nocardia cyriacigeorgica]|uniref:class IV adenylate cyclase n=1 Tax=Nocardia cyriacigeorgica TaxID=135487 RepID=UPI0018948D5B|nr:class IV adenylate cyclase [Nocardia cyriacigeorgica]MBF6158978.1 class IV adenylate cyclase [Nocardia cyriacigeorgica]MBF6197336.1 class IV adenylate cyclase [Nocardia cyriacigeorgica]MBF6513618.1 class IV adenylate cyclase [Nocardia cyriacigeorgica]